MRKGQTRQFHQQFKPSVCEGDSIRAELPGGFTAIAFVNNDDSRDTPPERDDGFWPSRDPKSAGYIGPKSASAFRRQMARAKAC